MRHDFADQFQVRYHHPNGESYDTWISGEEVLSRLHAADAEERLKRLGQLQLDDLAAAREEAERRLKGTLRNQLRNRLADGVDDFVGGNPLGDSLVENVRGQKAEADSEEKEAARWQGYLHDNAFRAIALELAWINLRGSFPDTDTEAGEAGWV